MAVNFVMFFVSVLVLSGRVESKLGQEEQRALLRFINGTKHPNPVRWNDSVSVCDWVGVMCADRSFVFSVRLPGARLVGSILPNTLGRLQQLRVLSLRFNGLSGKIPSDFSNLTLLRSLYLQNNNFSGGFPESVTRLGKRLRRLDLSSNNFSGPIPLTVDNLTNLTDLFLENNNFSGNLPSINLVYLRHFNVSNNNLNGQIPKGLAKFPAEAFIGNPDLCGAPLPSCFRSSAISPPPPSPSPIPPPPSPSLTPPLPSPPSPSLTPPLPSPPSPSLTPPLPSPSLTPPLPSPPSPSLTPPLPSPSLTPLPAEHEGNSNKPPTGAIFAIAVGSAVVALLLLLFLILCLRRQRRQPPEQQKTPIVPRPVATEEGTSSSKDGITCGSAEAERNKLVFYEGAVYSFELEDLLRASTEVLE